MKKDSFSKNIKYKKVYLIIFVTTAGHCISHENSVENYLQTSVEKNCF